MSSASPRALRALALVLAFLVAGTLPAVARKHDGNATGLRTVRYREVPPDFAYDVGDGPARLSGLHGHVVVLNFWATWCEPCQAELSAFAQLRATLGTAVPILTVSAESPGVARAFLLARHLDMPVVEDPARKIFDAYSVEPIPVTIVLGCDLTVRHVSVGELDWPELRDAVAAAREAPDGAPLAASASGVGSQCSE